MTGKGDNTSLIHKVFRMITLSLMGVFRSFWLQSSKGFTHLVLIRTTNYLWFNDWLQWQWQYLVLVIDCVYLSYSNTELYLWIKLDKMLCHLDLLVPNVILPWGERRDSDFWEKSEKSGKGTIFIYFLSVQLNLLWRWTLETF